MRKENVLVNPTSKIFAENLRGVLIAKNISQNKLSRDANLSLPHLNRVVNGRNNIGLEYALKISLALDVDLKDLIKGSEEILISEVCCDY
jgi:transcriptional regulator with XRE-family HTH domain